MLDKSLSALSRKCPTKKTFLHVHHPRSFGPCSISPVRDFWMLYSMAALQVLLTALSILDIFGGAERTAPVLYKSMTGKFMVGPLSPRSKLDKFEATLRECAYVGFQVAENVHPSIFLATTSIMCDIWVHLLPMYAIPDT